jgi:ABC-type sulfate/molybdate transport systems ATPase subunit
MQDVCCRKLDSLNLSIKSGESVAILGASGEGKSTLLKVIAGLLAYKGMVSFNGKCVSTLATYKRSLGYLSQDLYLFPHLNVSSNIRLASLFSTNKQGSHTQKISRILDLTHAAHLAQRYPSQLSGGEQQRVALARCLVREPSLLLLDEPFCSLDQNTKFSLWHEFNDLRRKLAMTMLIVTHDPDEAAILADRVLYLSDGQLYDCANSTQLTKFN